jgi:hypothetical protein
MTVEVILPRPLKERLCGLRREDMELVLHSYLVTGVLPEAVIARMVERNKLHHTKDALVARAEPMYLRLLEAEGS